MKIFNTILLSAVSALLISGCNSTPTPPDDNAIDQSLPRVSVNGHIEDMKSVAFEWKPITDPRVNGIFVYRNDPDSSDMQLRRHETITSRFATHYVDTDVEPNTNYRYFFTAFSDKAQGDKSGFISVKTLPVIPSVSWIQSIQDMPRSVKIIWRPHTDQRVSGYILERKSLDDSDFKKIATINGRLTAEYIDGNLDDGQVYRYRLRAVTYDNIVSTPSMIVQAVTKQIPQDIKGLKVSNDVPKKIMLSWLPSTTKDFAYYNVYRGSSATGGFDYLAKVTNNSYTDNVKEDGQQYFYKVTAVDKDELESSKDLLGLQGITLSRPNKPNIMEAKIIDNKLELSWAKTDFRTQSYIVVKTIKKGWMDSEISEIKGITGTHYEDTHIYAGVEYKYQVKSVDENKIESEPSDEVVVSSNSLPVYNGDVTNPSQPAQGNGQEQMSQPSQVTQPEVNTPSGTSIEAAPNIDTSNL